MIRRRLGLLKVVLAGLLIAAYTASIACGASETKVVETVIVEKPIEKVVQRTVVVEKVVQQTVVVEKVVQQTVVVEKPIEKVVKETVVVEKIVVATAAPAPTQAPIATAAPVKKPPTGTLVVALDRIGAPSFVPKIQPYPQALLEWSFGIAECLGGSSPEGFDATPWLGTSWSVTPDGSTVNIELRKGVRWHREWGEFTAQDVKWTMDSVRAEGSIASNNSAYSLVQDVVVANDYLVQVKYKAPYAFWDSEISLSTGGCQPMVSKRVADKLGQAVANITPVGTGPFEVDRWVSGDIMEARAVNPHWKNTPLVAKLQVLEVPEAATRVAMMLTGEVNISDVPFVDIPRITKAGGKTVGIGAGVQQLVAFGGNYWLKKDVKGQPLAKRPGFDPSRPWIGDPDNAAAMENARKVRLAMSLAIDRQKIVDTIQGGLGRPEYEPYGGFGTPSRPLPQKYVIPYDPQQAKRLLTEAGYPNGFEVPFWMPEGVARHDLQVVEAYFSFWEAIGLKVKARRSAYTAGRPELVARSFKDVWAWARGAPYRPDSGQECSGSDIGAFNLAFENELAQEICLKGQTELDPLKRTALHEQYTDYNHNWHLLVGTTFAPKLYVIGPAVVEWRPWLLLEPWMTRLDTVALK
jgi:ABC-type transport system substrate-binding protein